MKDREIMAEAGLVPAILALQEAGFTVEHGAGNGSNRWRAASTDLKPMSEQPLSMLGLVVMRKSRGVDWMATDHAIEHVLHEFGFSGEGA